MLLNLTVYIFLAFTYHGAAMTHTFYTKDACDQAVKIAHAKESNYDVYCVQDELPNAVLH
jgi:hypothetical protein